MDQPSPGWCRTLSVMWQVFCTWFTIGMWLFAPLVIAGLVAQHLSEGTQERFVPVFVTLKDYAGLVLFLAGPPASVLIVAWRHRAAHRARNGRPRDAEPAPPSDPT